MLEIGSYDWSPIRLEDLEDLGNTDLGRKDGTRYTRERRANDQHLHSDYIQIRSPVYLPHSAGRYAVKRFRKANCPIIERLTNSLMMHGRNNGKKLMAVRIVAHAFEIVRLPETRNNLRYAIIQTQSLTHDI